MGGGRSKHSGPDIGPLLAQIARMSEQQAAWARERTELENRQRDAQAAIERMQAEMKAAGEATAEMKGKLEAAQKQVAAIQAEKEAKERAVQERAEAARKRVAAIGMDNVRDLNVAFVGMTGVGKSSLINCLRGLRKGDPGYADVAAGMMGTVKSAKYAHPMAERLKFWDVPGGGDSFNPTESYWTDQCLDLFDCLVLVLDNRFPVVAKLVLSKALEAGRPIVVVHNKSLTAINNMVEDEGLDRAAARSKLQSNVRAGMLKDVPRAATLVPLLVEAHSIRNGDPHLDEALFIDSLFASCAARSPVPITTAEMIARFRAAREDPTAMGTSAAPSRATAVTTAAGGCGDGAVTAAVVEAK